MFISLAAISLSALASIAGASPTPSSAALVARARNAIEFNERIIANQTYRSPSRRAEEDPEWAVTKPKLKAEIDAAIEATTGLPHFFWTGIVGPGEGESVMARAMKIATDRHGTTLEGTLHDVEMPVFGKDPDGDSEDIWQYASEMYAAAAHGDVYVVKGEAVRRGNVWDTYEYPQLKKTSDVTHIFRISVTTTQVANPVQIFPEVDGCDGVVFIDRLITCPAGAHLYYGSVKKPMVNANTKAATDGTIKISTSGNAPGITRECMEILTGEFISQLFTESGVCAAATSRGNNGAVMRSVKQLLVSERNRKYLQQQRIFKLAAKIVDRVKIDALTRSLLDSLVAIDFYRETQAETAALTRQIDDMVLTATGKSPGLAAAWRDKTSEMAPTKAALIAQLQTLVAQKVGQARETAQRQGDCGGSPPASPTGSKLVKRRSMERRYLSAFTPAPRSPLERRAQNLKAPRSGPNAPPAPSCPPPGAKPKTVVPREKVKTKPAPATKPRVAQTKPKPKPPARKTTVKRPANRPRRQPGKPAPPKKRITPKKKPRKVPKPATKPKGKVRPRRR